MTPPWGVNDTIPIGRVIHPWSGDNELSFGTAARTASQSGGGQRGYLESLLVAMGMRPSSRASGMEMSWTSGGGVFGVIEETD